MEGERYGHNGVYQVPSHYAIIRGEVIDNMELLYYSSAYPVVIRDSVEARLIEDVHPCSSIDEYSVDPLSVYVDRQD